MSKTTIITAIAAAAILAGCGLEDRIARNRFAEVESQCARQAEAMRVPEGIERGQAIRACVLEWAYPTRN